MGFKDKVTAALKPATKKASERAEAKARAAGSSPEEVEAAGKAAAKDTRSRGTTTGGGIA